MEEQNIGSGQNHVGVRDCRGRFIKGCQRLDLMGEKNPSKKVEVRQKISKALKGVKRNSLSDDHKKKLSEIHIRLGTRPPSAMGLVRSLETRMKLSMALRGKVRTQSDKDRQSVRMKSNPLRYWLGKKRISMTGKSHWAWKGGITSEAVMIRSSPQYDRWRRVVFQRDDYRCFDCGKRGGKLHAHHIYPFATCPRLRLELENGRTLCVDCHRNTLTWGSGANNMMRESWLKVECKA